MRSPCTIGRRCAYFVPLCLLVWAWCTQPSAGAEREPPLVGALQAKLQVPLDTRKLKPGSEIIASVEKTWRGPDCLLRAGATVYGHITEVNRRAKGQPTTLNVLFDHADCNGNRQTPFGLQLAAVNLPVIKLEADVLSAEIGIFEDGAVPGTGASGAGTGTLTTRNGGLTQAGTVVLGGASGNGGGRPLTGTGLSTSGVGPDDGLQMQAPTPAIGAQPVKFNDGFHLDEVRGVPNVSLRRRTGDSSADLLSNKGDFLIGLRTQLMLVAVKPGSGSEPTPALSAREETAAPISEKSSGTLTVPELKLAEAPPPIDMTEVCAANCNVISDTVSARTLPGNEGAPIAVDLENLGYKPRSLGSANVLDRETTLTFLSARTLLVTFDPHRLRERTGEAWHSGTRRVVRVVLIDTDKRRVERVADWQVDGGSEYLWRVGNNHILVHTQGGLHLLDSALHVERAIPVRGEILWVAVSPSGHRMAVGTLNERHDKRTHDLIKEQTGAEPEEDVEMILLDETGKELLHRVGSSAMHAPVLTDEGEAIVRPVGTNHWAITERNPQGAELHRITEVNSNCPPRLSAPAHDLLLLQGCSAAGQRWFRMLRSDGRTLLKNPPATDQIEPNAVYTGGSLFAVGVMKLKQPLELGGKIFSGDLQSQIVEVFRLKDGQPVVDVANDRFPPSRQAYAVSADDKKLAVLTDAEVVLYNVQPRSH
ncbi:MAG TPA: hypothetical protein VGN16_11460 [Acidobacteriaceae bacterium]